jgi:hypothetical protein
MDQILEVVYIIVFIPSFIVGFCALVYLGALAMEATSRLLDATLDDWDK